jgi:hypothetical protein
MRLDVQEGTLARLQGLIGELPPVRSESTIASNLRLIARLGRPESVLTLLEEILEDDRMLAEIAAGSYRHVNHFDKIVLVDSEHQSDYRLTFHLWNPPYTEEELNEELIHDHRFSFWSTVVTGTLRSESFSRAEGGLNFRQYEYVPERRTRMNFYEFVGEAVLRSDGATEKPAGTSYYLSYEKIHRVQLPHTAMTCTLVLRGPRERSHSNVFNTTYPDGSLRITNRPFSPDQLATKLADLAETIARRLAYAGSRPMTTR